MRLLRARGLAACTILVVACQRSPAPSPPPPLDALARPVLARARVPAIAFAAVTRNSEITGVVGEAPGADAPFEAASIAKTIVATCAMQLVDEGKLRLDADVSAYVGMPVRHPKHAQAVTLRMLLAHTSSLKDDFDALSARADVPLDVFLRGYLRRPAASVWFDDEPGTRMHYSNAGAALAALAVERAAGRPFGEVAKARVLVPLGMTSSSWGVDPSRPYARGHVAKGAAFAETPPPSHAVYPVVDLFASARDLARFARAILRGGELDGVRVLSAERVAEMLRPSPPGEALGWQVRRFGAFDVVGHEGEDAGASTGLYVDLARGVGAVVLANGDAFASGDGARAAALGGLVEALLGAAPAAR